MRDGPLSSLRVVELAGLGPVPFCGMWLADLGADVVRVDRSDADPPMAGSVDFLGRGKRSVAIDLKSEAGVDLVRRAAERADVLIEGFRPGVAERIGIGPDICLERNERLVYGRMTGWGQDGPLSGRAGHDIDYIAISGVLHAIGPVANPVPPLNLVGDFGGGAMFLAAGVVAAVLEARETGRGQVVDVSMVEGSALLTTMMHAGVAAGWWSPQRESNLLDGGAPFYTTYRTSDGEHMAVGAIEPRFFAELVDGLGLRPESVPLQMDRNRWPEMRQIFAARFAERTRGEWTEVFEGSDSCVAPVLSLVEAPRHPHNHHRRVFVESGAGLQPAPSPRFSMHQETGVEDAPAIGENTDEVLAELGVQPGEIIKLRDSGVVV